MACVPIHSSRSLVWTRQIRASWGCWSGGNESPRPTTRRPSRVHEASFGPVRVGHRRRPGLEERPREPGFPIVGRPFGNDRSHTPRIVRPDDARHLGPGRGPWPRGDLRRDPRGTRGDRRRWVGPARASWTTDRPARPVTSDAARSADPSDSHGLTTARTRPSATTTTPTTTGSTPPAARTDLDRLELADSPAHRGTEGVRSQDRGRYGARRRSDQPASGTTRPSASIVAWRRRRLSSAPGHLVAGVVARADERRRLDVLEAERERLDLHLGELVGVVVALERQVLQRRAQVLADGQDVDVDRAQRLERLGAARRASRRGRPSG